MKAIVLAVKNGRAALLLEDGTTTYRNMKCRPGERVEISGHTSDIRTFSVRRIAAAAAVAVLLTAGGGAYYNMALPVSFVAEDVNPSFEYTLNRLDRVIEFAPINEEARSLASEINPKGMTLEAAVCETNTILKDREYTGDKEYIMFAVTSESDEHAGYIEKKLADLMKNESEEEVSYSILRATDEEHDNARRLHMSSGRYMKLLDDHGKEGTDDESLVAEYQKKPVRDFIEKKVKKTEKKPESVEVKPAENAAVQDISEPESEYGVPAETPEKQNKQADVPVENDTVPSLGEDNKAGEEMENSPEPDMDDDTDDHMSGEEREGHNPGENTSPGAPGMSDSADRPGGHEDRGIPSDIGFQDSNQGGSFDRIPESDNPGNDRMDVNAPHGDQANNPPDGPGAPTGDPGGGNHGGEPGGGGDKPGPGPGMVQ